MTAFKPFPELTLEDGNDDGLYRVQRLNGHVIIAGHFANRSLAERLVDCWNACRKLYSPAAHIEATDDYVKRLEQLRKDALAMGSGAASAGWSFDMTAAPRDGTHVILAMPNKTTLRSYWCTPKGEPEHWCMLSHKNEPVAWMLWPDHPNANPEAKASVDNAATNAEEKAPAGREMRVGEAPPGSVPATSEGGRDSLERQALQFIIEDVGSV